MFSLGVWWLPQKPADNSKSNVFVVRSLLFMTSPAAITVHEVGVAFLGVARSQDAGPWAGHRGLGEA